MGSSLALDTGAVLHWKIKGRRKGLGVFGEMPNSLVTNSTFEVFTLFDSKGRDWTYLGCLVFLELTV